MTNPTQAAPAASIKPSVADDKNKPSTEAAKNDQTAQPDPAVKSEPAVAAKV